MRPAFCPSWYRAICALAVLLLACDGGGGGGDPTDPSTPLALQPARSEYATFEHARVTVRGASLSSGSYTGTLGSAAISAQPSSDSTLVFQVPELAAGTHTLTLEIGRRSATAQLGVRVTPPLEDPVAFVASVDSVFLYEVEGLEDWYAEADPSLDRFLDAEGFAADLAMMRATLAELRADFQALSPADQREVAMTVQAFLAVDATAAALQFAQFAQVTASDEHFPQCQFPEVETVEEMRACQRQHRGEMVNRAKTVEQCNIDFDAEWEEGNYADAVGKNYIAYQCLKARMLKMKRDVAETVRSTVFGWFGVDNTANAQSLALYDVVLDGYDHRFVSDAGWPHFAPPISFRNLHAEDIGELAAATELGVLMEAYQEGWDELNAMFPRPFQQSPPWIHQLYQRNEVMLGYDRASLSLGRIEPASVTGSAEVIDGQWVLTFSGPYDGSDPTLDFSFETIFDNAEFGTDTLVVHSDLLVHPLGGTWDTQVSLEVSDWRARLDGSRYERAGRCSGTVEWSGERMRGRDESTEIVRFGSSDNLFCAEYDGITNEIQTVNFPWAYDPANDWVGEGESQTGSLDVDGQSVSVSGVLTGAWGGTISTSISATLVDGRMEGTYERVDDFGDDGRLFVSGTFVAVKRR